MRINVASSKNRKFYRIIETVHKIGGGQKTVILENLGSDLTLKQLFPDLDPLDVAKNRLHELKLERAQSEFSLIPQLSSSKLIPLNKQFAFKAGYLFLSKIYHALNLDKFCSNISDKYKFDFNLSDILSTLIYTRIINPASKRSSFEIAKSYLEAPSFQLHDIYRALAVIAKDSDDLQAFVYKQSKKLVKRNDKILFYDCTNFFFEIEQTKGLKQFGYSKEHRPNPIVQMGLFLDGSGFPLAFSINPGNTNEQKTLKPLEKKILKDFGLSKLVVCTDAGLSSTENRIFNNFGERAFITTQSIKKLKGFLRDWALSPEGWSLANSDLTFSLNDIDEDDPSQFEKIYYKSRWINEDGLEQKIVVSYSLKYKRYLQSIRNEQIERAKIKLQTPASLKKKRPTDPSRFIKQYSYTADGEIADNSKFTLDQEAILAESIFDGFYAVCTNLEAECTDIIMLNKQRWAIEAAFREIKADFKTRPVYLQRDDRIIAHFITCFLSLLIFRILQDKVSKLLPHKNITSSDLLKTLHGLDFHLLSSEAYVPNYTRSDLTDALHEAVGFRTDYEILSAKQVKNIIRLSKQ